MALKLLVTFLLLISIGGIYSKTLLEKIRDDSDLSQVSFSSKIIFVGFRVAHQRSSVKILLLDSRCRLGEKRSEKKIETILASVGKRYITGDECCVI